MDNHSFYFSSLKFRSVQMRLYALHKRQFVAVFAIFFICLFITILIGFAGPSIILSINYKTEDKPNHLVNESFLFFLMKKFSLIIFFLNLVWTIQT